MKRYENNHKDVLWNSLHRQVIEQRERRKDKNFVAGKIGGAAYQPDMEDHSIGVAKPQNVNRRSMSPLDRFNMLNDDDRLRALMPQQDVGRQQREPSQYSETSPTKAHASKRLSTWDRYVHASDENRLSKLLSSSDNALMRSAPRAGTETSLAIGSEHHNHHEDEKKAQYKHFLLQQIEEKKQRGRKGHISSDGGWFNNEQRKVHTHRGEYRRDQPIDNRDLDRQEWGSPHTRRNPRGGEERPEEHFNHASPFQDDSAALKKEALKNDLLTQIEEKKARKQAEKNAELAMDHRRLHNQQRSPSVSRNVSPNASRNPHIAVEQPPMYASQQQWGSPTMNQNEHYDQSPYMHSDAPLGFSLNNSKPKLAATDDQVAAAEEQRAKVLQLKQELEHQIEEKKRAKAAQKQFEKEEEERIDREVQRVAKEEQDRVEAEKEKRRQKAIEDENARVHVAAMLQQEEDRKAEAVRKVPHVVVQDDAHQSSSQPAKAYLQVGHTESQPQMKVNPEYRGYRSELPRDDSFNDAPQHRYEAPPQNEEPPQPAPQVHAAKTSFEKYIRDVDERPFERDTVLGRNKWNPSDHHQSPEVERRTPYAYNRVDNVKQDFNQRQPEPLSVTVLEEAHHHNHTVVRESSPPQPHKFVFNHHTTYQHGSPQVTTSPPLLPAARPLDEPEGPDSLEGSRIIIRDPDTPSKSPIARHVGRDGGRDKRRKSFQDVRTSLEALHRVIADEPMPEKVAAYEHKSYEIEAPTPIVSHEHHDVITQHHEDTSQHHDVITPIKEEHTPYKSFLDKEPSSVGGGASVGLSRFDAGHYNTNVDAMYRLPPIDRVTQLDADEESHHGRILSKTHQSPNTLKPLHNAPTLKKGSTVNGLSQLERDLMAEVSAMARDRQSHRLRPIQRPLEVYVVEDDYMPF